MSKLPSQYSPDEAHAHPKHTGLRWFDLLTALTALIISAVSLYVGTEHAATTRQLVEGNTWPFLQANAEIDKFGEGPIANRSSIAVQNQGVGPAKVETFTLSYRGRTMRSAAELLETCCALSKDPALRKQQTPNGFALGQLTDNVLRPGDEITLIEVRLPRDAPAEAKQLFTAFDAAITDITFSACYCSVFDTCWTTTLRTLETTPVKACPVDANAFNRRLD